MLIVKVHTQWFRANMSTTIRAAFFETFTIAIPRAGINTETNLSGFGFGLGTQTRFFLSCKIINSPFPDFHNAPCCPPTFCIRIVFIFFWGGCDTKEKWKTKLCKILGRNFMNKVHYGKCGSGVWCFIRSLCYAVSGEPFFPNFYEKIQEICSFILSWTIFLYLRLLVYIFSENDTNFTILGRSLSTRDFIL